ncbi:hypothetical protein B0H17DRAFT_1337963 [Mycena rosella]|uniref:Novel STAND NTPase 1 domain-containing protein n=1 Tax=Mycena rosella TaxID=1033263 RepID=A0AAD7CPI5_MYCRO|nr:hypothetical protein B0H17DRAFT_1337963 [Mycena rosella]
MPSLELKGIIEYTTLAASTTQEIAISAGVPFLGSVASLTLAILKVVETVRANKEQCFRLVDKIHTILCAIIGISSASVGDGGIAPAVFRDIESFMETLQRIYSVMKAQQAMGRIKQLFRQPEMASKLYSCQAELRQSQEKFQIQAGTQTAIETSRVQRDAKQQHEELMARIAANPDLTSDSDQSSSGTRTTLSHFGHSIISLTLLPARPQIFHGRDIELRDVIDILTQSTPARIVILGPGGMGKTALTTAALHHPDVTRKYAERYFISCHATTACTDLISILADYLGVEPGSYLAHRVTRFLKYAPPTLLVLDNFETLWESETRPAVEEFLATVTEVAHVALLITMRGAERPAKVKWTRPFLLPLRPLDDSAALRTFVDIAGDDHEESLVTQVLELTGNLPLAVSLMASVVSHDGCEKTLSRWNTEKTRVLSDGYDKGSSLEISLTVSLTSSRMTPEAHELLSLLSILPDGLSQGEILHSKLPIRNVLGCKSTLIQTSLAYVDVGKRLRVLPPVREYVRAVYPPSPPLKAALRKHYHEILRAWDIQRSNTHILENFRNLQVLLADALSAGCGDFRQTLVSALRFDQFALGMNPASQRLLETFDPYLAEWGADSVYGKYLGNRVVSATAKDPDVHDYIIRGNSYFERASPGRKVEWYKVLGIYYAKQDQTATAIHWYRQVISAESASETPPAVLAESMCCLAQILNTIGKHYAGRIWALRASKHIENLGSLAIESQALTMEAICCRSLGDLPHATRCLNHANELLVACGLQQSWAYTNVEAQRAELFLLKTEYAEARRLNGRIVEHASPISLVVVVARVNIAFIDIQTGGEIGPWVGPIRGEIDDCRALCKGPLASTVGVMICDAALVDLELREGSLQGARSKLEKYFMASRQHFAEMEIFCLERLADIGLGWKDIERTMEWAVIFLASASGRKNRLAGTKALRCLGAIFSVQQENDTALSLFEVACTGFAAMGVYRSHADCLRGMAGVHEERGDFAKAGDLLMKARPLYERCQQAREIERLDAKVQAMEELLMASGHTLATLAQLRIPVEAPNSQNERSGDEKIGDDRRRSDLIRL